MVRLFCNFGDLQRGVHYEGTARLLFIRQAKECLLRTMKSLPTYTFSMRMVGSRPADSRVLVKAASKQMLARIFSKKY